MPRPTTSVCLAIANEPTENLIDADALAKMRKDAVFINVSCGNLVDEAALAAAIRDGKIAGAALDVGRAPDRMPTPAIAALPNVIATPHIGGLTPARDQGAGTAYCGAGAGAGFRRGAGRRGQCRDLGRRI